MARETPAIGPTMIDVAREAGVSQSCVSLVLNEVPGARLSKATRQRVLSVAQKLGYTLPTRRQKKQVEGAVRNSIAYVVDEISINPHAVLHIDGARDAAWAAECLLQAHVTRGNRELEAETLAAIGRDSSVIGIIYANSFTRKVDPPAIPAGCPAVLVNCYTSDRIHPALLPGDVAGGFAATQHLLSHGHSRIGMICGEAWMDAARDRLKGYREALTTADIGLDPDLVREGDWSAASGYEHTMALMALRNPPTAIFCANDTMALGTMEALSELNLSVPEDISLIGYNDLNFARHLRPPLTSLRAPNYDLGQRAVELLIDMALLDKPRRASTLKLECQLVTRGTVAACTPRPSLDADGVRMILEQR